MMRLGRALAAAALTVAVAAGSGALYALKQHEQTLQTEIAEAAALSQATSGSKPGDRVPGHPPKKASKGTANSKGKKAHTSGQVIIKIGTPQPLTKLNRRQQKVCQIALQSMVHPLPRAFDASGYIQWVYAQAGIHLPRTFAEQSRTGVQIRDRHALQPGDLVFFSDSDTSHNVTFAGIYLPGGQVAALTTHGLRAFSLSDPYWSPKFQFGTRVV